MNLKICLAMVIVLLLVPATAYTRPENCRGVHLDEAQTIIAPCEGFFVPRERSQELLIAESLFEAELAANELLREENAQLIEKDKKNKKKLMNRKLWKGLTIGMVVQGAIIIAIVAL